MSYQRLKEPLEGLGIPFAFHHWDRPPQMPYGVYFDDSTDNFEADNIAYVVIRHFNIELYVRQRDQDLEGRMEKILTDADLYWDKDSTYVASERFFKISYEIEV